MKKKKKKKREKMQGRMAGLLPIFCFESRYSRLYRDTRRIGAHMARHDTVAIRPPRATIRPARTQGRATARARGLASGVCHDTILCNVTGGAGLASRYNAPGAAIWRNSVPRYCAGGCDTRGSARDMGLSAHEAGACVAIQTLYRDRGGYDTVLCRDTAATWQAQTLRHGKPKRCDKTR